MYPEFRSFTTHLFWELNKTTNAILDALIMSLKLTEKEAEAVRALHTGHDNQLRLLHYPSISSEMLANEKDIGRLGVHTDWRLVYSFFSEKSDGDGLIPEQHLHPPFPRYPWRFRVSKSSDW